MDISEKEIEKLRDVEYCRLVDMAKQTVLFLSKKTSCGADADFVFSYILGGMAKRSSDNLEKKLGEIKEDDLDEESAMEIAELDRDTQKITKERWANLLTRICFSKYLKNKEKNNDYR